MAGSKRARPRADSQGVEVVEASSHLRQRNASRKRARLTPAEQVSDDETLPSDTFEEETDGANEDEAEAVDGVVDAQQGDMDSEDEGALRSVAQLMSARAQLPNQAADIGIVEEVTCTNFMCHSHLTVSIGPLINFIIGHNGSGKSAVLTALQLCLGSKATSTNRGQSLKHFIKAGEDQATLRVRIKNQGDTAYQPEIYGPSIIVERFFNQDGSSGFKIKNAQGKIVSTKKSELEDILDAMALQMDNPMNVLTQDMARQFLNSSNPGDKYKFFYKGTHLEQLDTDYGIMAESLDKNIQQGYNLKESAEKAQKEHKLAERNFALAERADSLRDKIHNLRNQCAWAQVEEQEKDLARLEHELREQEGKIQGRKDTFEQHDARSQAAAEAVASAEAAMKPLQDALEALQGDHAEYKARFDARKSELMEIIRQQREIKGTIQLSEKNIIRVKQAIIVEKEKLASADNGQHVRKMEEIQDAKDRLEELQQEVRAKSGESAPLDRACHDAEEEIRSLRTKRETCTRDADSAQKQLAMLQRNSGNWMSNFDGEGLPRLLQAIEREHRFLEKPVGPLGRHVTLLNSTWSSVLEKSAGGVLDSFAVTSKRDQSLLSELMHRTKHVRTIYVTSSRPIDVTQHEPAPEFLTWLRVLSFDNDQARNVMIINQKIEQTVLEANVQTATQLLVERNANVSQYFAIQKQDNRGVFGARLALSNSGQPGQTPIEPWRGNLRMQTDRASQISIQQERVTNLKREQAAAEEAFREVQSRLQQATQAIKRHKRDIDNLKLSVDRQDEHVAQLVGELEEATPQTGLVEELEKQLQEHLETKEMDENQYGDTVTAKDQLNREAKTEMADLNAVIEEISAAEANIEQAAQGISEAQLKRERITREANAAHNDITSAVQEKEELEEQRAEQATVVIQFTEQAEKVSRRVSVDAGETADSLGAKLIRLNNERMQHERSVGGNKEQLSLLKTEAMIYMDQRTRALEHHTMIVDKLKKALTNRRSRWEKFRNAIATRARATFIWLLQERQFRGQLSIDHTNKVLDIHVQPDHTNSSNKGRQTKTLSGGEKSFSTICLLLALWEAMGSPIRCLDEFDVFMDSVNREVSMKMMIDAARRSITRQFILITPQAMNNVTLGPDVKIHKMRDPERNQTTLRASQFVAAA